MKTVLTQEKLKELVDYDPDTGVFTWKIEPPNRPYLKDRMAGGRNGKGYVDIMIGGVIFKAHRLAFLWEKGYLPENDVDHINNIKHDNRSINLRESSKSCNMRNRGNQQNNASGINGVGWRNDQGKWSAYISVNKKLKRLKNCDCIIEAAAHRFAAEQCLNWGDCKIDSSAGRLIKDYVKCNQR